MENANASVKIIDIMLFKEFKNIIKKLRMLLQFFLFVSNTIAKLEM